MAKKLMKLGLLAVGVLTFSVTAGCASGPKAEKAAKATEGSGPEPRVCINSNRIRTFDALSDKYVYVREGRDGHYLLTMQTRCQNLRDAYSMAFINTTSRICSNGFGKVRYSDRFSERDLGSCRIKKIEQVADKEHAKQIAESRKGPPNDGTWSEPPETESADAATEVPDPE